MMVLNGPVIVSMWITLIVIIYGWPRKTLRLQAWCQKHWWPLRITNLQIENSYWKRQYELSATKETHPLLIQSWGIIANVDNGDLTKQSIEWQTAVINWRTLFLDRYGEVRIILTPDGWRATDDDNIAS